jgi:GNAT superfamily N-acetyltransferase
MCGMKMDTENILKAAWKGYAERFPAYFAVAHPALEIYGAGIAVPLFNLAYLKGAYLKGDGEIRGEELERLIGEFGEILAARGISGLLMVRSDRVVAAEGMEPMLRMPGMVARGLLAPTHAVGKLDIREVAGTEMARELSRLNVVCHEMAAEDVEKMTLAELWGGPNHGFLLYSDGAAVAGGSASLVDGVSYIGWMATLREHRGRGYAEGILRYMDAFMRKRYGVTESVLHATALGRPVYERLGYGAVDEWDGYFCGAAGSAATG